MPGSVAVLPSAPRWIELRSLANQSEVSACWHTIPFLGDLRHSHDTAILIPRTTNITRTIFLNDSGLNQRSRL